MSIRNLVRFGAAALVAFATAGTATAAPLEIRIATLAPEGSAWMNILNEGVVEIDAKTEKRVKVTYYAGGLKGDEKDYVRKIKLGEIDAAALTSVGLSMVDPSIRVLELPRLFATVEEFEFVANKMWPYFKKKFAKAGYKLQDRGEVGWVYVMSKNEIKSLADLRKQKLWVWGEDQIVSAMYKTLGVAGVPLSVPEVDPGLTSGKINACYGSALAAVALQWNTKVKYIGSKLPMSYALGATVIKTDVFNKMSEADQKAFDKIGTAKSKALRKKVRKENLNALKAMKRGGVKESDTPPEMIAEFDNAAQKVWKELVGKVYSQEELDTVLKHRDAYRAKHPLPTAPTTK